MRDSTQQSQGGDSWTMRGGGEAVIRPIRGDDEAMMRRFHGSLSAESVYTRYFNFLKLSERVAHARLDRICHPEAGDKTVLVVETPTPDGAGRQIVGVGRLSEIPGTGAGEVAVVVSDSHQRKGIGSELVRRLIADGRRRKLRRLRAHILSSNIAMQRLCTGVGMRLGDTQNEGEVTAEMEL